MIRDLFGNPCPEPEKDKQTGPISHKNDQRPAKEIFMPTTEERKRLEKIMGSYSLGELKNQLGPSCYQLAQKYRLYYLDSKGKEQCPQAIVEMISGHQQYKKDWVSFLAIMRYYRNLHLYYDEMSKAEKRLMEKVLTDHYVTFEDAEKILGQKCTHKVKNYYYESMELIPKISFWYERDNLLGHDKSNRFSHSRVYRDHLYLLRGLQHDLVKAFYPGWLVIEKRHEISEKEQLVTYDNEQMIHTYLPMLRVMYKTKQIEFGSNKCNATTVKKVAKMTGLREFFQTEDKDASRLAAWLMTNIYCLDAMENGVADFSVENDIRTIWTDMVREPSYFPALILSHITGFRKNLMMYCDCEKICIALIAVLKSSRGDDGWLKMEDICHVVRNQDNAEEHCLWLDRYNFERMTIKNTYDESEILSVDILRELTYPFMKGFMFMLAVFGMAEIAYSPEPSAGDTCFYDTLRYVRLTPLGKYAIGITSKYEAPQPQTAVKLFEMYDDNLMVKSVADPNPYESVLNNMATPISKHLYKVSYETFLDSCTCKSDITNKIQLFHTYVCKEPPANWKQFFKEMEDRCKPMKAPQKKYSLLQIPVGDKELQRIVLNDPVVRKYTLKAEEFILLVETTNKSKVVDALKKYGYLI